MSLALFQQGQHLPMYGKAIFLHIEIENLVHLSKALSTDVTAVTEVNFTIIFKIGWTKPPLKALTNPILYSS